MCGVRSSRTSSRAIWCCRAHWTPSPAPAMSGPKRLSAMTSRKSKRATIPEPPARRARCLIVAGSTGRERRGTEGVRRPLLPPPSQTPQAPSRYADAHRSLLVEASRRHRLACRYVAQRRTGWRASSQPAACSADDRALLEHQGDHGRVRCRTDGSGAEAIEHPMDAWMAFSVVRPHAGPQGRGQACPHHHRQGHADSGDMLEQRPRGRHHVDGRLVEMVLVLPTLGIADIAESMRADAAGGVGVRQPLTKTMGSRSSPGTASTLRRRRGRDRGTILGADEADALHACESDRPPPRRRHRRYVVFLKEERSPVNCRWTAQDRHGRFERRDLQGGPAVFTELGAEVTGIHDSPQRLQHQRRTRLQHTEDLRKVVVETGSMIGFAYDGDGDRLIPSTSRNGIRGDQSPDDLRAHQLKQEGRLANDPAGHHGHQQPEASSCLREGTDQTPRCRGRRRQRPGGHASSVEAWAAQTRATSSSSTTTPPRWHPDLAPASGDDAARRQAVVRARASDGHLPQRLIDIDVTSS